MVTDASRIAASAVRPDAIPTASTFEMLFAEGGSKSSFDHLSMRALTCLDYFAQIRETAERVGQVLQVLITSGAPHAVFLDTDVIVGAMFSRIQEWGLKDPVFPKLDKVSGPNALDLILRSTETVHIPTGTVVELDYLRTRISKRSTNLLRPFQATFSDRAAVDDGVIDRAVRDFEKVPIQSLGKSLGQALDKIGSSDLLLDLAAKVAPPQRADRDASFTRRWFQEAFVRLSYRRMGVPINNACDAWNLVEVAGLASAGSDFTPLHITNTKPVLNMWAETPRGTETQNFAALNPRQYVFLLDLLQKHNYQRAGTIAYPAALYDCGIITGKAESLAGIAEHIMDECRMSDPASGTAREIAYQTIKSGYDRLQNQFSSFERSWAAQTSRFDGIEQADSLLLLDAATHLESGETRQRAERKRSPPPRPMDSFKNGISERLACIRGASESRSELYTLRYLFELERGRSLKDTSAGRESFRWFKGVDETTVDAEFGADDWTPLSVSLEDGHAACFVEGNPEAILVVDQWQYRKNWVVDIGFRPVHAPEELWNKNMQSFVRPIQEAGQSIIHERALWREWVIEHSISPGGNDGVRLTDWASLAETDDTEETTGPSPDGLHLKVAKDLAEETSIRYAEASIDDVTVHIRPPKSHFEAYSCGIRLPVSRLSDLKARLAEFLSACSRWRLSTQVYLAILERLTSHLNYTPHDEEIKEGACG